MYQKIMVEDDNSDYILSVYGITKEAVFIKPRAHVRNMSHTNIDDCLTILGLALYQRLEDINVFRMFVKAAEKYYQASHPMHLVLPSAQELSHTAILSIRGPDMPTDAKRYMSMLHQTAYTGYTGARQYQVLSRSAARSAELFAC